jgi:adenosylmethionine---8-amino-7-oxononanoate aminotransferase
MANIWLPYTQMQNAAIPFEVKSAHGSTLTLQNGCTLIDAVGSWWTSCHGYQHPKLIAALKRQADSLAHVMLGGLTHQPIIEFTNKLCAKLPATLEHAVYSESGSVAVEIAMKIASQSWYHQNQKRTQFLHLQHGYHGDTFYTMSVGDPEQGMHAQFGDLLPKQCCICLPQTEQAFAMLDLHLSQHQHELAAFIVEPRVQGAGGMKFLDPVLLNKTCELIRHYQIPVIFDEIFTGFGRTGTLFALEQIGFVPDIICLSKGITGGVTPFAVTIANSELYNHFLSVEPGKALMHASTYSGHALGAAVGLASLELFDELPWQSCVAQIENQLIHGLNPCRELPGVQDVRALGAIGVVEMSYDLGPFQQFLINDFAEQGIWCRPFGNIIYTTPSFNILPEQLAQITRSICNSVERISREWHDDSST